MSLATHPPNPTSTSDSAEPDQSHSLKTRVVRSGFAMFLRQLLTKPIAFLANILLARLLIPEQFGLYSIVATAVALFGIFGDAGLASALVRSEQQPTADEEDSIFTLQQLVVGVPLILLILGAPLVVDMFHLGHQHDWLVRLVALSGFVTTFRVIPCVRLIRRLRLDTVANIEIAESLVFNLTVITLAYLKCGTWSFPLASLVSQSCGVWLTFTAEPWSVRWRITNWETCRSALKFGAKVQFVSIVNCVRVSMTNMWIGFICGATALGFISFAYTTAQYPFMIGAAFSGLYLPVFSQVQTDKRAMARAGELAIRTNNLLIFGLASVLIPTAPLVVLHVFGAKWLPTLPMIYFLLIPVLFFGTNTVVTGLCQAAGHADIPLRWSCWLAAGTFITMIPLVLALGAIGYGVAQPLLILFNFALYRETAKVVPFKLAPQILPTLAAAALNSCLTTVAIQHLHVINVYGLAVVCLSSLAFFFLIANVVWKNEIWRQSVSLALVLLRKTKLSSVSC